MNLINVSFVIESAWGTVVLGSSLGYWATYFDDSISPSRCILIHWIWIEYMGDDF